jgi:hypothetical protein
MTQPPSDPFAAVPDPNEPAATDAAPFAGAVGATTLPAAAPPRSRRTLFIVLGAVVTVFVVGAAAAGAVAYGFLSGGGTQPEDVVPGTALGMVRIDLDPPAGQKVALAQLVARAGLFGDDGEGGDPAVTPPAGEEQSPSELLSELLGAATDRDIDFARDVEPWIGQRAGLALMPPSDGGPLDTDDPQPLVALATDDEAAARASLERLFPAAEGYAVAVRDGFVLVGAQADVNASGPVLAENPAFTKAEEAIGDTVAFGYFDIDTTIEQAEAAGEDVADVRNALGTVPSPIGRRAVTFGVAVQPDGIDVSGHLYGVTEPAAVPGDPVAVGGNSVGLVVLRGLGPLVTQVAERSGAATDNGFDPAQLEAALGSVAQLETAPKPDGELAVRGSIVSDDLGATEEFWQGVGFFFGLDVTNDGSRVVIQPSADAASAEQVFGAATTDSPLLAALPDAATANVAMVADLAKAEAAGVDLEQDGPALGTVGLTLSTRTPGDAELRLIVRVE